MHYQEIKSYQKTRGQGIVEPIRWIEHSKRLDRLRDKVLPSDAKKTNKRLVIGKNTFKNKKNTQSFQYALPRN